MDSLPFRLLRSSRLLVLGFAVPVAVSAQTAPGPILLDSAWNPPSAAFDFSRARAAARTARLANVSIRATAGSGADTLIAGAVVQGSGTLPTLVRAIGPGLSRFGVSNALRDPRLQVFRGSDLAAQTTSLVSMAAAASSYVGAFPAQDTGDAALVGQVPAGVLTAHCSSAGTASGVALLEFYDAASEPTATSARFVNLSSRARVDTGENVIVVGFVVAGEGDLTLLLRGAGRSLDQFGVAGTLADPVIELFSGSQRIAANDNWRSAGAGAMAAVADASAAVGAFALTNDNDAALVVTLPAGAYTLVVSGAAGQTGVALAEIHEVVPGDFDVARATNSAGLDVYRELLRKRPTENVVISPYSIETALALAYAGAEGVTRDEMARVLRLPSGNGALQVGFAGLRRALEAAAENSKAVADARTRAGAATDPIAWSAANRLFGHQGYPFRESFLALMRDGFQAPMELVDFVRNFEGARLQINGWVEEQTRQKIKDLIPQGGVTSDSRLVLVNALYLKAPWDSPFTASATTPRPFFATAGSGRDVPTMQQTAALGHTVEDGFTVVTLDYIGRELQFVIALPDEGVALDAAAARLTPAHFTRWAKLGDNSRRQVALWLPKFKLEGLTVPLAEALKALGMKTAFDEPPGSANFNGIGPRAGGDYLALSNVFHKTFVAVDEQGTEAAAATAVVAGITSAPPTPVTVRVERPFFFAIQHRASGACLFLGNVRNPQ